MALDLNTTLKTEAEIVTAVPAQLRKESNLYHHKFVTRAFAVWGHAMLAALIVWGCMFAVVLMFAGIGATGR